MCVCVCVCVCVKEEGDYFSFQRFVVFGTVPWQLPVKLGFCWFSSLTAKCQQAVSIAMVSPWRVHGQVSC